MAKDAKVGSLIGLVLIFIMAFVINGFTRSGGAQNNTVPSTTTTDNIGDFDTNGYSSTDLPTTGGAGIDDSTSNTEVTDSLVSHPTTEPNVPEQVTDEGSEVPESELEKSSLSEVYYAVCKGDNLAEIAKKFYGPEEGNKRANIKRLFEANRNVLTSPHKLSIGQKLLIPSLEVLKAKNNKAESVFADSMFETVKSIGGKPSSATKSDTNQSRLYAVQEGDSLWSIADNLLGDGTRYKEIQKLNSIILKDEDLLSVGMRLRIPSQ